MFRASFHERVFGLDGCNWLNSVRSANGFRTRLREAEVQDFPAWIRSLTAPATSSIGTAGSTRCW